MPENRVITLEDMWSTLFATSFSNDRGIYISSSVCDDIINDEVELRLPSGTYMVFPSISEASLSLGICSTHLSLYYQMYGTKVGRKWSCDYHEDLLKNNLTGINGEANCRTTVGSAIGTNIGDSGVSVGASKRKFHALCGSSPQANSPTTDFYEPIKPIGGTLVSGRSRSVPQYLVDYTQSTTMVKREKVESKPDIEKDGTTSFPKKLLQCVSGFTGVVLHTFSSISAASKQLQIAKSEISACCRGDSQYLGLKFRHLTHDGPVDKGLEMPITLLKSYFYHRLCLQNAVPEDGNDEDDNEEEEESELDATSEERIQSMAEEGWMFEPFSHPFIGLRVRKFFTRFYYADGTVAAYLPSTNNEGLALWNIQFDDNDCEDADYGEIVEYHCLLVDDADKLMSSEFPDVNPSTDEKVPHDSRDSGTLFSSHSKVRVTENSVRTFSEVGSGEKFKVPPVGSDYQCEVSDFFESTAPVNEPHFSHFCMAENTAATGVSCGVDVHQSHSQNKDCFPIGTIVIVHRDRKRMNEMSEQKYHKGYVYIEAVPDSYDTEDVHVSPVANSVLACVIGIVDMSSALIENGAHCSSSLLHDELYSMMPVGGLVTAHSILLVFDGTTTLRVKASQCTSKYGPGSPGSTDSTVGTIHWSSEKVKHFLVARELFADDITSIRRYILKVTMNSVDPSGLSVQQENNDLIGGGIDLLPLPDVIEFYYFLHPFGFTKTNSQSVCLAVFECADCILSNSVSCLASIGKILNQGK